MDAIRADIPAAAFFLLGAGVGVWLTVVSRPVGEIVGTALMFAGGSLLTSRWFGLPIPALHQDRATWRALLDKAITDGSVLSTITDPDHLVAEYQHWHATVYELLRDRWGLAEATAFRTAGDQVPGQDYRPVAAAQISYLEALRKRRARR